MEISEIRVKLMNDKDEKLQAFCSVTFNDDFVIRDLKIIGGSKGPFVAMPSRKLMDKCSKCGGKNHLRSRFCNDCGSRLDPNRADKDRRGRARLHTDIAHPINSRFREIIQSKILDAFREEQIKASQPGYVSPNLGIEEEYTEPAPAPRQRSSDSSDDDWDRDNQKKKRLETDEKDAFDAGIFS